MTRKTPSEKQSPTQQRIKKRKVMKKDSPSQQENKEIPELQCKNNEERYYCKNANLLREMLKWKNSTTQGLPVYKKIRGKMVKTESNVNGDYQHEKYTSGTKYYVMFAKNSLRYDFLRQKDKIGDLETSKDGMYIEDVTKTVEHQGYAFDIDEDETHRTISEALGMMMIQIAEKVSNHSFFRNYNIWDKSEMQSYAYEKIIRGLPNYSFKFTNVFAYFTQACFNSFKSILSKHYKQLNIKRDLAKRAMINLQTDLPGSSMERCLGNQFKGNDYDDFSEF